MWEISRVFMKGVSKCHNGCRFFHSPTFCHIKYNANLIAQLPQTCLLNSVCPSTQIPIWTSIRIRSHSCCMSQASGAVDEVVGCDRFWQSQLGAPCGGCGVSSGFLIQRLWFIYINRNTFLQRFQIYSKLDRAPRAEIIMPMQPRTVLVISPPFILRLSQLKCRAIVFRLHLVDFKVKQVSDRDLRLLIGFWRSS